MPLYEYECFLCRRRFERIQKFSDEPVTRCPSCGGSVRRLLGVPALQFKGSGWYVTDYGKGGGGSRDEAPKPSATDDKPAKAAGEGKSGASGDGKEPGPGPSTG